MSGVESAARAVNVKTDLTVTERRVMGVPVPSVELNVAEMPPHYGPAMTSVWTDEAVERFRDALAAIGVLAETRIAVTRLALAIQRTLRRVNALEKVFIPDYQETKKYVEDSIEDSERDALALLKLIKDRMETDAPTQ